MATGNETPWAVPLSGRDRAEEHRSSTPLELFFDLIFVVAIAAAAANLHHGLAEAHWGNLGGYLVVFFAIWWAWMNFTWFASAYDTNDVVFRALTLVSDGRGARARGRGSRALNDGDYDVVVLGYAIMRFAMVVFWLRAARGHPERRSTCLTYAVGIAVRAGAVDRAAPLAHGWGGVVSFGLLVGLELLVPVLAERRGATPWHPGHIVERYGLMTIIVLGEVLLSTSGAIAAALDEHGFTAVAGRHRGRRAARRVLPLVVLLQALLRGAPRRGGEREPVPLGLRPLRHLRLGGSGRCRARGRHRRRGAHRARCRAGRPP